MRRAVHYTPPRPFTRLTDAEWAALAPFLARAEDAPGRPLATDPRTRMEAFLATTVSGRAWRETPEGYGRPNSIARHFRRLAEGGTWTRLLKAVAHRRAPPVLRAMEYWICRLARRAMRHLGMRGLALARTLGLLTALPMLPWFLPNPDLSQTVQALVRKVIKRLPHDPPPPGTFTRLGRLLAIAGGRLVWSRRFAPP